VGGGRSMAAPGSAPKRAVRSQWEGGWGQGVWGAPESAPGIRRKRARAPPRSTRKRNKKHHVSCSAMDQGSVTWTGCLRQGECFSVHYVTVCWPMRSTFHV